MASSIAQSEVSNDLALYEIKEPNVNLDPAVNPDQSDSLSSEVQERIEELRQRERPVTILTGAGKSTLINAAHSHFLLLFNIPYVLYNDLFIPTTLR